MRARTVSYCWTNYLLGGKAIRSEHTKRPEDCEIVYDGKQYPAAVCPICRGKISPPAALPAHVAHHQDRYDWIRRSCTPLKQTFKKMRLNKYVGE